MIDDSFGYIILIFGWRQSEDYDLYIINLRFVIKITVFDFVKDLEKSYICVGVKLIERCYDVLLYVILKFLGDVLFEDLGFLFFYEEFWRIRNCVVLLEEKDLQCDSCFKYFYRV